MYSEFRAIEAMKILSLRREGESILVRWGRGEGRVIRSVSITKMRNSVMRRGLGRRKVRLKERGNIRLSMVVEVKCGESGGEVGPCHVRLTPESELEMRLRMVMSSWVSQAEAIELCNGGTGK
jgi:hypothetical protein